MSDYFTHTFNTDQLLMCEKEDLVKYIETLREEVVEYEYNSVHKDDVYDWVEADGTVILDKYEYKKLKEQRKPVTRSDTRIKQLEEQVEILKIESVYEKCVVKKMKSIIKELNDECGGLKERLVDMSFKVDELESHIELTDECVIDGLKQGHKDLQEEIDRLQEENEKLKEEIDERAEEKLVLRVEHMKKCIDLKKENEKLKEFINQQKVTVVKLDEHGQELKEENENYKNCLAEIWQTVGLDKE